MTFVGEFRKFALRGSVADMAVGFTVGAAFTTIVKSLVSDIVMPPIGLVLGQADFSDLFLVLREGATPAPYASLAQAQAGGAVTVNYGLFINNLLAFVVVAASVFVLVRVINRLNETLEEQFGAEKAELGDPTEKKCPYCLSTVAFKATRCPACTSRLEVPKSKASASANH